jgi:uncharacterized protein (TIGR02246 family)
MKRLILLLLLSLSAAADPKKDAETLASWFEAGAKAGNVEQMLAMYADDAVLLPPNMAAISGREGIGKYWGGMLQSGPVEVDLIMEEFLVDGDLAVDRGRYEITAPFKDSGKYLVVLRRRDGKWRVVTDIFNPSLPMAK